jgi:hypothetical protein
VIVAFIVVLVVGVAAVLITHKALAEELRGKVGVLETRLKALESKLRG